MSSAAPNEAVGVRIQNAALSVPHVANGISLASHCTAFPAVVGPSLCVHGSAFPAAESVDAGSDSLRADGSSFCVNGSSFRAGGSSFCVNGSSFRADGSSRCVNGSSFSANGSALPSSGSPLLPNDHPASPFAQKLALPQNGPASTKNYASATTVEVPPSAFPTVGSALLVAMSAVHTDGRPNSEIANNVLSTDEPAFRGSASSGSSAFSLDGLPLLTNEPSSPESTCCSRAGAAETCTSFRGTDFLASCVPSCTLSRTNSFPVEVIAVQMPTHGSSFDAYGTSTAEFTGAHPGFSCAKLSHTLRFENIGIQDEEHADIGVTLTWKDLWVTVADESNARVRSLLQNSTGFAEPGNIMAIMGPSGSGKSTLLDTLAGRLSPNVKQLGEVMVNGKRQTLSYGNSAYVTQDDVLLASLTVWEAVYYSAQLQLPKTMSNESKRKRAEGIIKDMGLQRVVNTRIGGWRARGLSGGEKRRVSIAIELLTRPRLLFLDEPTSGLDSAAAFNVVKRLKHLAMEGRTVVVSLHQPSGDVFELFDFLYLLSSGRTVYFGSTRQASEFFAINGFPCPPLQNPSEHFLRTINTDYEEMEDVASFKEEFNTKQVIDLLVEAYTNSNVVLEGMNRVNELLKEEGKVLHTASNHAGFSTHMCILTKRSFKNMHRDLAYYWFRLLMYIALSICIGTVFYNVGFSFSAIQARAALLMFVSGLLTFMSISGFPAFVEDLKVFERERLNGHYGVASFFVANTLSSSPYLFIIAVIPGAIAYFLAGLHPGFDRFAFFVLNLFVSVLVVESLMMMVASLVSDYLIGIIIGSGIQGLYLLNGGFFRLPHDIPKPLWRYPVSYMAFHTYSIQGFYKNDFEGLTFENRVSGLPPLTGDAILMTNFEVMPFSKWLDLLILLGMAVAYRFLFFAVIKSKERFGPVIRRFLTTKATLKVFSNGDD